MDIGTKIKAVREYRKLSKSQLAVVLNVSPSLVSMWEKGERVPSDLVTRNMCEFFGVPYEDFINEKVETIFVGEKVYKYKEDTNILLVTLIAIAFFLIGVTILITSFIFSQKMFRPSDLAFGYYYSDEDIMNYFYYFFVPFGFMFIATSIYLIIFNYFIVKKGDDSEISEETEEVKK